MEDCKPVFVDGKGHDQQVLGVIMRQEEKKKEKEKEKERNDMEPSDGRKFYGEMTGSPYVDLEEVALDEAWDNRRRGKRLAGLGGAD